MWRCTSKTLDWTKISFENSLPGQDLKPCDHFKRKLTISAHRDQSKSNVFLESTKEDQGKVGASLKADDIGPVNQLAASPNYSFKWHIDDKHNSMKSISPKWDNSALWDRHQYAIDSATEEVNSPTSRAPSDQDFSEKSFKNYISTFEKWATDRKNWEKREQNYQERIRANEEKIRNQKDLAKVRLQELIFVKDNAAASNALQQELESANLRITELEAQLQTTTDWATVLERRCNTHNCVKLEEEANVTLITELQRQIACAEKQLAKAGLNENPELKQKLKQFEKKIQEQNEKLKKLQLNCGDLNRNLHFEKEKSTQLEETITKLTEEKIILGKEHQKFILLKAELETLRSKKSTHESLENELENAKLENMGLRKSNRQLTRKLDELEQQSCRKKQNLQLRVKQQVSRIPCQLQTTNRRTPISELSSANQSAPISPVLELNEAQALRTTRSVDSSITTISIPPEDTALESNNVGISVADIKFLKTLRGMLAAGERESPQSSRKPKKSTSSPNEEKFNSTTQKPQECYNSKIKRKRNGKGKAKKTRSKISSAPTIKLKQWKCVPSDIAIRKPWCPG